MARRIHRRGSDDDEEDVEMDEVGPSDEEMLDATQEAGTSKDIPEAKRKNQKLRKEMRSQLEIVEGMRNDLTNISISAMKANKERQDELFKGVDNPQDAAFDSRYLQIMSDIAATKAKLMKHDAGAFDVDDFVAHLANILSLGGEEEGGQIEMDPNAWSKLGRKALAKSRRVPSVTFMLGPLSAEVKKRVQKPRVKFDKKDLEAAKPTELEEADIQKSENETAANVMAVSKLLDQACKGGRPINIFKFVINPEDFGESVENIFYLSFLIRDGGCTFEWREDESNPEPVIMACDAPTNDDYQEGLQKRQLVFEFDMETWKHAIEVFDIKESMIPTRPKPVIRLGQKWY